jgi:hypothetical protein
MANDEEQHNRANGRHTDAADKAAAQRIAKDAEQEAAKKRTDYANHDKTNHKKPKKIHFLLPKTSQGGRHTLIRIADEFMSKGRRFAVSMMPRQSAAMSSG